MSSDRAPGPGEGPFRVVAPDGAKPFRVVIGEMTAECDEVLAVMILERFRFRDMLKKLVAECEGCGRRIAKPTAETLWQAKDLLRRGQHDARVLAPAAGPGEGDGDE